MSDNKTMALAVMSGCGPIEQGTYIPPEVIEPIIGITRDKAAYGLALMGLRGSLQTLVEKQTGRFFQVCQRKSGIQFLDTSEAARYGSQWFRAYQRRKELVHLETCNAVDDHLDELSEQERRRYVEDRRFRARILLHDKAAEVGETDQDGDGK